MNRNVQTTFMPEDNRSEEGIALLVALFSLLILSSIGLALLTRATTEVLINDNFKRSRAAFFTAEAGVEEVRTDEAVREQHGQHARQNRSRKHDQHGRHDDHPDEDRHARQGHTRRTHRHRRYEEVDAAADG